MYEVNFPVADSLSGTIKMHIFSRALELTDNKNIVLGSQ